MGGVREAFRAQARVQKGTGKALGTEIAEGGSGGGLPRFLQTRGCAKQKSLQRLPNDQFY